MRRFAKYIILLQIIVGACAVFTASSAFNAYQDQVSKNYDYCNTDKDAKGHQNTKDCQGLIYKTLDDPVAFLTGLLVVATGALFVVTYLLFSLAAREGEKSNRLIFLEQRPWLTVDIEWQSDLTWTENGCSINVTFRIENVGKSPAIKCQHAVELLDGEGVHLTQRQAALAESIEPIIEGVTQISTIFPSKDARLIRQLKTTLSGSADRPVAICMIIAIKYQSVYNKEVLQTGFIYLANPGSSFVQKSIRRNEHMRAADLRWNIFADGRIS